MEEIEIEDTSEEDEDDAMPALEVDVHPPEGPVPAVADAPGVLHALQGGMLPEVLPDGGGINDDTISTSSYNSDASSMAALEGSVRPDFLALKQFCTATISECTRPQMRAAEQAPDPLETDSKLAPMDDLYRATLSMPKKKTAAPAGTDGYG